MGVLVLWQVGSSTRCSQFSPGAFTLPWRGRVAAEGGGVG
jgi:hypothetical protein